MEMHLSVLNFTGKVFFHYILMLEQRKQKQKQRARKFMNRNVTEFRHIMKDSYITENDLNWVINLRDNNIPAQVMPRDPQPPQVFFKKTKAFQIRCKSQEKLLGRKYYANEYDHMILKTENSVKQTEDQINFYSTLRSNQNCMPSSSSANVKKFDNYPFKDRKQLPKFIKKECIKKLRQLTCKDKQSALDGAHKQEPYSEKILTTKNYGLLQTFTKVHGRSEVSLPSLAWQMGLRSYIK